MKTFNGLFISLSVPYDLLKFQKFQGEIAEANCPFNKNYDITSRTYINGSFKLEVICLIIDKLS